MDELRLQGIDCCGGPEDNGKVCDFTRDLQWDREVGAVVCGVDHSLSYFKVHYASLCLMNNPGCLFVATNTDSRGHFSSSQEWPGAGATVGAIAAVVEQQPIVTGKPRGLILEEIETVHQVARKDMCIVGDRLDTDILWGRRHGVDTLLVMTGVTSERALFHPDNSIHPTYWTVSLGDLLSVKEHLMGGERRH